MTIQTITATGAGTFIVPDGVSSLTIEAWGAGGSGGGSSSGLSAGGGGGGYSIAIIAVSVGQTIFYTVGAGPTGSVNAGSAGGVSWVNPAANSQPASNGVVAGGGGGGDNNPNPGGAGSIGTTNFNGGAGQQAGAPGIGGGGGGGAGSAGNGSDGVIAGAGGAGGTPDGGAGGAGVASGTGNSGAAVGGGGGGSDSAGVGGNGANGQVRFTWIARFDTLGPTTLTNVPGKHFTKKQFGDLLGEIRDEAIAHNQLLEGLSDKERADLDFDVARAEFEELESSLGPTNYAKAMDAKEKLDKARKARDHHYFMEIVNKEWAKYNEKK